MFASSRVFHGFTLIELLVVIAIISLLVSILLPALSKAKELARRAACASQQRSLMLSTATYASEFNEWYPRGRWQSPTIMGNGTALSQAAGGQDTVIMTGKCPSWEPVDKDDHCFYSQSGAYGVPADAFHMTYFYAGGAGAVDADGNARNDANYWYGWAHQRKSYWKNRYEDPNAPGPAPRTDLRSNASNSAILIDRMWVEGNSMDPYRWDDAVGMIAPNHKDPSEYCDGGNATYLDGHTEWRDVVDIEEQVKTYYPFMFCY